MEERENKSSLKQVFDRGFFQKTLRPVIFEYFSSLRTKRIYKFCRRLLAVIILIAVTTINISGTKAQSYSLGATDISQGASEFNNIQTSATGVSLQAGNLGTWSNDTSPLDVPDLISNPEIQYGPSNTLYMLPGSGSGAFRRYWIEERRWENLAQLPFSDYSRMVSDGNRYLYVLGSSGFNFYRYDTYTNIWDKMADPPEELLTGSTMEYVGIGGGYLYAFRGGNLGYFWRFSVQSGTWEEMPSAISVYSVTTGSALMWDHGQYLYLIRGGQIYHLYRFDITQQYSGNPALAWNDRGQFYGGDPNYWIYDSSKTRMIYINANEFLEVNSLGIVCKYNVSNNSFTRINAPYAGRTYGVIGALEGFSVTYDGSSKVYMTTNPPSGHSGGLRVYDYGANQWDQGVADFTAPVWYYDAYVYDGVDTVYQISNRALSKRSLLTNVLTTLPPMPAIFNYNVCSFAVFRNNIIYVVTEGYNTIYDYNIDTGDWGSSLSTMPATYANYGAGIVDGGDGYLYVARGGGSQTFWRFNIGGNVWEVLSNVPVVLQYAAGIVKVGNKIYAFSDASTYSRVVSFDLSVQTWTEDKLPAMTIGTYPLYSRLVSNGTDTIYLLPGPNGTLNDYARRFYSYNITTKVWKRLADLPQMVRGYSIPMMVYRSGDIYVLRGDSDTRLWHWTPSAAAYKTSGTWYSKHYDLTQVSQFGQLGFDVAGSGTYVVSTRSSDNLAVWSSWVPLNGQNIASLPKRYLQFKVDFSGDGTQTSTVSNFAINYTQETTPPSLPTQFGAYDSQGGNQLTSGSTYQSHHPFFTWSGADDGINGSGVAGYYVYFGTDGNADPVTQGSYQTGTDFLSDTPFTAGDIDYFRMKVKDNLGNISQADTMFSYRYWFVSPPTSAGVETVQDFQQGTATNLDISDPNGSATLNHRATGSWSDGDLAVMPQTFKGGGAAYAKGSVYVLMGNNTKYFYRYDIEANQWLRISDSLASISAAGSSMRYDGSDYIYAIAGNSTVGFYRYSISHNVWYQLNGLPSPATGESSMTILGDGKLLITISYSGYSYIYDPATDSAEENAPSTSNFVGSTNLYYDGTDTVYTLAENSYLRKFVISENRWYTLMRAPAYFSDSQNMSFEAIGDYLYFFANRNASGYLAAKYSISQNKFTQISNPPLDGSSGNYVVTDGVRYVYILQNTLDGARQDNILIRYDTVADKYVPDLYYPGRSYVFDRATTSLNWNGYMSFGTESATSFYSSDWSSMTYDGSDTVYYKNYSNIVAYSISKRAQIGSWKDVYANYGHILYLDGYLYMTVGNGSNRFARQNLTTYEWEELATTPVALNLAYSPNLIADKEGRIYTTQVGNTKGFYRYTPGTNTWATLTQAPVNLYTGSTIVYDGSDKIYFSAGNGSSAFYAYSTVNSSWSGLLAAITNVPNSGSSAVYSNGSIYLLQGNGTKKMSAYNTADNTWADAPPAPTTVSRSSGFVKINSDFALMMPAGAKSAIWRFNFPSPTNGNNSYGTYTTKNFLLNGVFSYVGVEADVNIPDNTSIIIQTRSTDDGSTFSDWADTTEVKASSTHLTAHVNSPLRKNIQMRAILTSYNGFDNPKINDLKFNYYADITPPNNPTVLHVYTDSGKITEISNNTWYNVASPVIDWPDPGAAGGATDGVIGSNIKGYYIYVGTDNTAVPQSQGTFVNTSEYTPALTQSGLYYIRLQTVDGSNNVSTATYDPFLYKFDIDKPSNPISVSVDPAGYSETNAYSFTWLTASDANSGVKEYCYKTNATDGAYATEQCQTETSLVAIPAAYQQGVNVLHVRTRDYAGNFSDGATDVSFYYNSGPPSRPSNLVASPSSAIQNNFSFSWDVPVAYVGNIDKMAYYYSINTLPTEANTTRVEGRTLGPGPFATQPGANAFYLVAKDESGNIDWHAYASVNFFANTTAPGVPLNVTIADISSRISHRWNLALSWDPPENIGSGLDHYNIERSDDKLHFSRIGDSAVTAFVDTTPSQDEVYFYQVKGADSVDNEGAASTIVSLSPAGKQSVPPEVISGPDVALGSTSATITWSTDRACPGYVAFGTEHDNLSENSGSIEPLTAHKVVIGGLKPNTAYYYKLQNFDQDREYSLDSSYSILRTFRTEQAPMIQNVAVSNITLDSATVNWNSQGAVDYKILYGKSITYGLSTTGTPSSENISVKLAELDHTSNYHFRIVSNTVNGDQISSDDYNFNTVAYPTVTDIKFQPVEAPTTSVEVSWKTNVKATSVVSYQLSATIKEVSSGDLVTDHTMTLSNLADNTDYAILLKGVDEYGNAFSSQTVNWKSAVDTRPPTIQYLKVEPNYNSSGDSAQLIVTWQTDEPATSQVEYGEFTKEKKFDSKTAQDNNLTTNHIVIISGLKTTTTYHIRPISLDKSGNSAIGEDTICVVNSRQNTITEVLINIFQSIFSWLGGK